MSRVLKGVILLQVRDNPQPSSSSSLRRLGVKGVEIRKPEQLNTINALIIPGGESTTMAKLAEYHNLFPALREFVKMGKPVWGTCAGLIFLADKAVGQKEGGQELVGGLHCTVHRNFFGSQIQSFEAEIDVPELVAKEGGLASFRGVFIRAPAILEAGTDVEVIRKHNLIPLRFVITNNFFVFRNILFKKNRISDLIRSLKADAKSPLQMSISDGIRSLKPVAKCISDRFNKTPSLILATTFVR
ncbi:pyridoxal 5'-phosphate synthase (glutamine hydrolyzing) [Ranunculus cassubicifolius]